MVITPATTRRTGSTNPHISQPFTGNLLRSSSPPVVTPSSVYRRFGAPLIPAG
jgi:hypothetical protein